MGRASAIAAATLLLAAARVAGDCVITQDWGAPTPRKAVGTETKPFANLNLACPQYQSSGCCNGYQDINLFINENLITLGFGVTSDGGCPACAANMKAFWCAFTCSPEQDRWMKVLGNGTADGAPVLFIEMLVSAEFACATFDSCKNTANAARISEMHAAEGLFNYLGNGPQAITHGTYVTFTYGHAVDEEGSSSSEEGEGAAVWAPGASREGLYVSPFGATHRIPESKRRRLMYGDAAPPRGARGAAVAAAVEDAEAAALPPYARPAGGMCAALRRGRRAAAVASEAPSVEPVPSASATAPPAAPSSSAPAAASPSPSVSASAAPPAPFTRPLNPSPFYCCNFTIPGSTETACSCVTCPGVCGQAPCLGAVPGVPTPTPANLGPSGDAIGASLLPSVLNGFVWEVLPFLYGSLVVVSLMMWGWETCRRKRRLAAAAAAAAASKSSDVGARTPLLAADAFVPSQPAAGAAGFAAIN